MSFFDKIKDIMSATDEDDDFDEVETSSKNEQRGKERDSKDAAATTVTTGKRPHSSRANARAARAASPRLLRVSASRDHRYRSHL